MVHSLLPQFYTRTLKNSGPFLAACDDVQDMRLESMMGSFHSPHKIEYRMYVLTLGFAFEGTMPKTILLAMTMLEKMFSEKQAVVVSKKDIKLKLDNGYSLPTIPCGPLIHPDWWRGDVCLRLRWVCYLCVHLSIRACAVTVRS